MRQNLPFDTRCQYGAAHTRRTVGVPGHPKKENAMTEQTLERTDIQADAELVEEDTLVEEVSIDGMCGVY